jgi:hypothetical protein
MTFDEYCLRAVKHYREIKADTVDYRLGQAYMNILHNVRCELSEEITGSMYDCFYDDSLIGGFLYYLADRWEK